MALLPALRSPRARPLLLGVVLAACGEGPTLAPPEGAIDLSAPWVEAAPAEVGLDPARLEEADVAAAGIERMRSLLVVRRGRLAFERYYGGATADSLADVRSVTKSVLSTLVGIALEEGSLASLDQPMTEVLTPPRFAVTEAHESITVRHLLTMTGGFRWEEVGGRGYDAWITSPDRIGYVLGVPVDDDPGSVFNYNSGAVHLLGVLLAEATGAPLERYADEVLLGPLGIAARRWEPLPEGWVNGGSGLDLRPRDLARFGQLQLQEGWSGSHSVVPPAWIEEARTRRVSTVTTAGPIPRVSYGYLWWLDLDGGDFFAWGFSGQFVYVSPALEMVVVATTEWRRVREDVGPEALQDAVLDVIVDQVLAAAR